MEQLARVLVVEDERHVARFLGDTLGALGYLVTSLVTTGEEAIARARSDLPSVILMDICLDGAMDGIEAASRIRADRDVPVVFLTAHADEETLARAKQTGPLAYLVKPFRGPELRCAIELALHKHQSEAKLRAREQWLTTTLRSIGDGVVATDAEHKITLLNPVAEALTGWRQDEAIGRRVDEIVHLVADCTSPAVEQPAPRAIARGTEPTLQRDAILVGKGGSSVPVTDSIAPIVDPSGATIGNVIVLRDVSAEREAANTILQLNAELEHRVVERTRQLQAAYNELEAFSFAVAHDLRAPVRRMDWFSQALFEDHATNLSSEGLSYLQRVRGAAKRMGTLIEDLLRLSQTASVPVERRAVDVSSLAWSVTEALRSLSPERDDVVVEIQPDIVADGDFGLVRILLENLLGNAWKFTAHQAAPRIEVGARQEDGARVVFIRDNGIGFDARTAHQLFGAFQRFHAAAEFDGGGIGLAIAQRIVNRHGGRIWADSEPGHGATFFFTL